jgi:hypothetical protein
LSTGALQRFTTCMGPQTEALPTQTTGADTACPFGIGRVARGYSYRTEPSRYSRGLLEGPLGKREHTVDLFAADFGEPLEEFLDG